VSEDPQPDASPDTPVSEYASPEVTQGPGQDAGQGVSLAGETHLSDIVVSHLTDQVRRTTQAAKARRVTKTDGEPGMTDLTPLRELVTELMEELRKVKPRERVARMLRDAANIIDPPTG